MNLIQCVTCGASSITNGKCDYCGNQYETETIFEEQKEQETTYTELRFQDTPAGPPNLNEPLPGRYPHRTGTPAPTLHR